MNPSNGLGRVKNRLSLMGWEHVGSIGSLVRLIELRVDLDFFTCKIIMIIISVNMIIFISRKKKLKVKKKDTNGIM